MAGSVGDLLAASRRRLLFGRETELGLLRDFLTDDRAVMAYLHGPGGVGKTSVLEALVAGTVETAGTVEPAAIPEPAGTPEATATTEAAGSTRPVIRLDCADLEPTVPGFLRAVQRGDSPVVAGTVLVIDRFEILEPLAAWFWRTFVPALPAGVRLLVAGRCPPAESWRNDPAFADRVVVLPIRNLTAAGAAELVRSRGFSDPATVDELVRATYGHPLAIVIATDGGGRGPMTTAGAGVLVDHPDAAARLLGRFLEDGVTPLQRNGLHVCGHARRVDRAMLREVLGLNDPGADALLDWLRQRPYAEIHPDGLTLHDVVRDALDRDLRWRDRAAFAHLHTRIRAVVVDRMATCPETEHDRWAGDLLHLHRGNPEARSLFAFEDLRAVTARPLRIGDEDEITWVTTVFAAERRSAAVAYWLAEQPTAWTVFEDAQGRRSGAYLAARLDLAGPGAARADPVAGWVQRMLAERRPPEPGEIVLYQLALDADAPGRIGIVSDQAAAASMRSWRARGLGWAVTSTVHEQGWAPVWTYAGFERLGTCAVGNADIGVWARDFSRSPFADWLAGMAAHELDEAGTAPPPVAAPVALSRADFGEAIRGLLKDFHDPARLRRNPLTGSRLATGDHPADALQHHVRRAIHQVGTVPKQHTAARVLDRTFVRPAGTQEKAAEVLGLPFSTYRRQLANGIERLEAVLWDWELHGPPQDS